MNECKYELWARANDIKDLILPEDDAKEKSLRRPIDIPAEVFEAYDEDAKCDGGVAVPARDRTSQPDAAE